MNEERLGSTAVFARELAVHLGALAESGANLPETQDLERLVELAFFAGLHEEEARRAEATLAWTGAVHQCTAVLALRSPVPATPKNIAKLAPTVERGATSLAVRREGEDLVIWALLQHDAAAKLPLMIRSLAAGVLRVDWRGIPRALYARGEIRLLGGEHVVQSPAERLTAAFASWAATQSAPPRIDPRAATVTHIAARALSHGHGGMILIVQNNNKTVRSLLRCKRQT